jgi:hypothetical protein
VGAPDQLHAASGDHGVVGRLRSDSRLLLAVVGGAILVLAWIGWAIYVASSDGARAGLGVLIAWPALLVALALVSLPFIGGYLVIRRLSSTDAETGGAAGEEENSMADDEEEDSEGEEEDDERDEDEGSEDEPDGDEGPQDESDEEEDGSDEEPGDDSESDPEPEAAKS